MLIRLVVVLQYNTITARAKLSQKIVSLREELELQLQDNLIMTL